MPNKMKSKTILVTGGTGSFGNKFASMSLKKFKKIIIFSRDELKQYEMEKKFDLKKNKNLRFFLGDIRDKDRLRFAFRDVDIVLHAAALKQVPRAEYNPIEYIKTNVLGAQNIIEASLETKVSKVIALSTDKAVSPINLYGATKLCSDKLFLAANNIKGNSNKIFSVLRYGNVTMSRGSVIPFFLKNKSDIYPVTDSKMTRFCITLEESVNAAHFVINNAVGGEVFVPKVPSYKILDLVKAINKNAKIKIMGVRPGEKLFEELISSNDSNSVFDSGEFYIVKSSIKKLYKNYKEMPKNFSYTSDNNPYFYSINQLKKIILKTRQDE
jgi:UDP-N-acetylglucosamine 4,6-dehydratase (inverting)